MKKLTRAWKKGKKIFPSVYGVKNEFARDLILMGDIERDDADNTFDLQYSSRYLESKGWKWVKYEES